MGSANRWQEVVATAPEFAARVQAAFDAHKHKTMATLRADGAPRISGTEANFNDGELWIGMMPGSVKARDLQRDARVALHSATVDPALTLGDAKVAGRAMPVTDEERLRAWLPDSTTDQATVMALEIDEVVITRIGEPADHLVIESWTPQRGLKAIRRA